MVRHAKRASVFTLLFSVSLPTVAWAQDIAPMPQRQVVDQNGVNLATGQLNIQDTAISIGTAEHGLSFARIYSPGGGWSHTARYGLFSITGSTSVYAVVAGQTISFALTGGAYVNSGGGPETLTGSSGSYTLTLGDGTIIALSDAPFDHSTGRFWTMYNSHTLAVPTTITKPDGEVLTFYYHQNLSSGGLSVSFVRPRTIASSNGYAIRFEYAGATGGVPTKVYLMNMASEYCDPNADSCTLSGSWPTLTFTATTTPTITDSSTDSMGHTTTYAGGPFSVTGIQRPTSTANNVTITRGSGLAGGNVASITRDGMTWNYSFSQSGSLVTAVVTNPDSSTRTVLSDATVGLPTSVTDELGHTTTYTYYSNGLVHTIVAPEGNETDFTYDARGNLTQTTNIPKSGSPLSNIATSAVFPSTCSNAVTCNEPTSTTDALGNITDYSYDSTHGGVLTVTAPAPATGATRPEKRYSYTALQAYYKNSGGSIVASGVNTYELTGVSECQAGSSPSCVGTSDEVKTTIAYGATGVANNLLPASVTVAAGDASLTVTNTTTYDPTGNVLTVDGPLSGTDDTTTYRYDLDRRRVGVISPDPDGSGSMKRRAVKTTYNADDQPTIVEIGNVNGTTDTDWNGFTSLQQLTSTYNANGFKTRDVVTASPTTYNVADYSYDAVGRPECTALRMNSAVWGSAYAACSLNTTGSYGADRITKTTYDAVGRVTKVQTGYGVSGVQADDATVTYTNNGRTATATDAEGNKTSYTYDGFDRLTKTQYPGTTKGAGTSSSTDYEELVLNAGSQVTSRRLRGYSSDSTQHIDYTYDHLGRLTAKDLPGSEPDVAYTYDLLGRMTGASQTGNALTFTYDALGRNLTQAGPQGTVSYQYDAAGQRTQLTWPDSFYVTYDHLVTGEVSVIRENGATSGVGVLATYAYDDLGRRTSLTYGNGTSSTYSYDNASRLASLAINLDGSTTTNDVTTTFGYSPANAIATQTRSNDLYFWDGHTNVARSYTSNGLNQLTASGTVSLGYDARGNLTSAGSDSYGYSSENLLTSATVSGLSMSYDYDPMLRLYKQHNASPMANQRFVYDGTDSIAAYNDTTGAIQRRTVFGPGADEPLVDYISGVRTFQHADERGSIVARSNDSGAKTAISSFDEYGLPGPTNAVARFQYTGQAWLPQLGMYYYKARFYSPTLGRFMQTDPIGYGDGMNWYAYTHNDPINGIDPEGLACVHHVVTYSVQTVDKQTGKPIGEPKEVARLYYDVGCEVAGATYVNLVTGPYPIPDAVKNKIRPMLRYLIREGERTVANIRFWQCVRDVSQGITDSVFSKETGVGIGGSVMLSVGQSFRKFPNSYSYGPPLTRGIKSSLPGVVLSLGTAEVLGAYHGYSTSEWCGK